MRDTMRRTSPKPVPKAPAKRRAARGEVYLVGAGPGDPDLLTVRAVKLMRRADVALYDSLISPGVLALLPARTERIYVGKQRANHTMRQEAINDLLVEHALAGQRVLDQQVVDRFLAHCVVGALLAHIDALGARRKQREDAG